MPKNILIVLSAFVFYIILEVVFTIGDIPVSYTHLACDYSQSRLAQELQISRQNLNEIENGKTKASKEMKHILFVFLPR